MTNPKNDAQKVTATPKDVADKKTGDENAKSIPLPPQATAPDDEQGIKDSPKDEKLSAVKRVKAAAQKLSKNRPVMLLLGTSLVVVGLTYKNNRKVVSVEPLDDGIDEVDTPGETPDSL